MNSDQWKTVLFEWSKIVNAESKYEPCSIVRPFHPELGFGAPGATADEIISAERRLGRTLPPSYKQFLTASNGLMQPIEGQAATGGDFLPVQEIDWFQVKNADWINAYVETLGDSPDVPDDKYFVYGAEQDTAWFRVAYLKNTLQISDRGDSGVYLLNPDVITGEGEWEAWHFANWHPGAVRFRSFEEMMLSRFERVKDMREKDEDWDQGF